MTLMTTERLLEQAIQDHQDAVEAAKGMAGDVSRAADLIIQALKSGRKLLLCGNGGSSSDAQHFAAELVGRFVTERQPLPAIPLAGLESTVTAVGNDYGYNEVFSRQVRAFGQPGDVLIAISTSGSSGNVIAAAEAAKELGLAVIGMTAQGGGRLRELSDVLLASPTPVTARAQEVHILLIHVICAAVDAAFAAPSAP